MRFRYAIPACFIFLSACSSGKTTIEPRLPIGAESQIEAGIKKADASFEIPKGYVIRGAIVPHHLTATETIASGIRMISGQNVQTIILVSPDHFFQCPTLICTVDATFRTPVGTVETDEGKFTTLSTQANITVESDLFENEHGIGAVLPYIRHYLPSVKVVPIVVSQHFKWATQQNDIANALRSIMDDRTLLVVSSDFSHYLSLAEADEHDEETAKALFSKDLDAVVKLNNPDNSDCPRCLWALATLADEGDFYNPSVVLHTNSARILGDASIPQTTSHFSMVWYANDHLSLDDPAFGGDVTVTRNSSGSSVPSISKKLKNFWDGSGPRVVNLEGPLLDRCDPDPNPFIFCNFLPVWRQVKSLATVWGTVNNHMIDQDEKGYRDTLRLLSRDEEGSIGIDQPYKDGRMEIFAETLVMNLPQGKEYMLQNRIEKLKKELAASKSPLKIVFLHYGDEYHALTSDKDAARLRSLVDAGADAVVGMHAHVPGDMEIYKGKPIFRGIGNFLFDQYFSAATRTAKAIRIKKDADGRVMFETIIS